MDNVREAVNRHFEGKEPFSVAVEVAGSLVALATATYLATNASEISENVKGLVFGGLRNLPQVKEQIEKEKQKIRTKVELQFAEKLPQEKVLVIPEAPLSHSEILSQMTELRDKEENNWKCGKVSGVVYSGDEQHTELMNKAYGLFSLTNPLHPDVFPSIKKFEAEIIRMTADMMNGDNAVCGAVTSGGTESIIMAVKAHRDFYNKKKPEIIIPVTAHAAFDKAGHYLGIKVVHVPVDPVTQKPNVADVARKINKNTILIVGSAPQYPHGVVDPIPELASLAQKHNIGFHSDCCLGGYLLPWLRRLGILEITPFDFSVPGVTSISVDTHKYGYSTKGTSVVLYKNEDLRRAMYFVQPNWPGGTYASPTFAGSRPGGLIACCWASLLAVGQKGFRERAKAIWDTAMIIKQGISETPGLHLVGDSYSSVIACGSNELDIFKVADGMSKRGWHLNTLQRPSSIHICVTLKHVGMEKEFLQDLKESVQIVRDNPNAFPDGLAPMYGMMASLPDRSIITDVVTSYLDAILTA